jgi:gliding motility-associated-like protein
MRVLLLSCLLLIAGGLYANDYYWVGGGGNWSDINHWRLGSSSGSKPNIVPSVADNVFFDANSGFGATAATKTVTLDGDGFCNNMTWSNVPNNPIFNTASATFTLEVRGNMVFSPTTTYNVQFDLRGGTTNTLTTGGNALGAFTLDIDKPGGGLTVVDSLISPSSNIELVSGAFNAAGKKLSLYTLISNSGNTRSLDISNSTVTAGYSYEVTGANKTVNAAGSVLNALNYIYMDGAVYNKVTNGARDADHFSIYNCTFSALTFTYSSYGWAARIQDGNTADTIRFMGTGSIGSNNNINVIIGLANINVGNNNIVDTLISAGGVAIGTGNTISRVEAGPVGGGAGGMVSGNTIGYWKHNGPFTVSGTGTNTVDSLLLTPGKIIAFQGTFNVNKYLELNGTTCDAFSEVSGDSTAGRLNFASGASAVMNNMILTGLKAYGPITPLTVAGIDNGGNAGFTITPPATAGTTLYWVNGSGDWNDRSHWSTSSGGTGGACVPYIGDDVVFDANSGLATGTVTTSSSSFCRNMTWTGVGNVTFSESASYKLNLYGSLVMDNSVTMNGVMEMVGSANASITTNGTTIGALQFSIAKTGSGVVTLADDWINPTGGSFVHWSGGLSLSGRTVNIAYYKSNINATRSVDISNAKLSFGQYWDYRGAGKSIVSTGSYLTASLFHADGLNYSTVDVTGVDVPFITGTTLGQLTFTNASATSAVGIGVANTIRLMEFKGKGLVNGGGNSIDTLILAGSRNYTFVGTNTINKYLQAQAASCAGLSEIKGNPAATLTFAAGAVTSMSNIYMQNMTATGPITPIAFSGADAGGNSGWNITTAAGGARYWVGGAGDWNDPIHWSATSGGTPGSACVPTVYDDVYFDAGSGFTSSSRTVTINNGNAYAHNVNWTGAANSPTWSKAASWNMEIWGDSLITTSPATFNLSLTLKGANPAFMKGGSPAGALDIYIDKPGGSLTLLSDYNNAQGRFFLTNGAFNASGRTLNFHTFTNSGLANTSSVDISNSTLTMAGSWGYTGSTASHAINTANSTITAQSFYADGFTYNKVNVNGAPSNSTQFNSTTIDSLVFTYATTVSAVGINGTNNNFNYVEYKGSGGIYGTSNTINTLVFSPGNNYILNAGTNTTITSAWYGSGTPCHLTQIYSSSTTSNATVTKTSGSVNFDYVRLRRITAAGAATPFTAGSHTDDQGGNTNWNIAPYNGASPISGLGPDQTLCDNAFPVTLNTDGFYAGPSATFLWNDGSTGTTLSVNNSGTYSVTVGYPDGCSISDNVQITRSTVTVNAISGNTTVCAGATTTLSSTTPGGVWSSSNTAVATVNTSGVVTGVAAGTATITYTVTNANGCSASQSATVTVKALPVVNNISGTFSVCAGATTALSNSTPGGTWSSSNTAVATVDNSGVVTGVAAGTATISYTVASNGCSTTKTADITVNALPAVGPITGNTAVCVGATTALSNSTPGGSWTSSDGLVATVDASGMVSGLAPGTVTIAYTVSDISSGCSTTQTTTVTVNAVPVVNDITGNTSVYAGTTTTLSNSTPGGVWSSANTGIATVDNNGVVTGVTAGTVNINYTVNNGSCSTTKTISITVLANNPADRVLSITGTNGAEPNTAGSLTISLPPGILASEDITVTYTTGGTATADKDYTALSGTAVIPMGSNSVTIPVTVLDDRLIEGSETVTASVTAGKSATFTYPASSAGGTVTLTITDDDQSSLTLSIAKNADAAEPGTNGSFTVSLPTGVTASEPIDVTYTVSGTAVNGTDYASLDGTLTIPAGTNSVQLPVNVIDDKMMELAETVTVTLQGGTTATLGNFTVNSAAGTATVDIADEDNTAANRVIGISKRTNTVEGGPLGAASLVFIPNGFTAAEDLTVQYTISGTATNGVDYKTLTGSMVLPAGTNNRALPVFSLDDQIIEGTETVTIQLTGGTTTTLGNFTASSTAGSATIDITDNDNASRVLSIVKTTDAAEPATNGTFTISLPAGVTATEPVTVNYTVSGTATAGADYTALSGTVMLPAGENSIVLPVTVTDDQLLENAETVIVTLTGGTTATLGNFTVNSSSAAATVNIADDENTTANRTLSVTAAGDAAEPSGNSSFVIALPANILASEDITVNYTISGTAANGVDYAALSGTATIPAGAHSITVPVTVSDDQVIEGTETVVLTLQNSSSASFTYPASSTNGAATLNINDNDNTPDKRILTIAKTADGAEPATAGSFTISLPAGMTAGSDIQVAFSLSPLSTAIAGSDYQPIAAGTVVIPAGQNSVTVPVNVINDYVIEPSPETVIMDITGGTDGNGISYTAGTNTATVNITDDDLNSSTNIVLVTQLSDAIEGGTDGQFKISLPPGVTSSEDVVVQYTLGGSASTPADYSLSSGIVSGHIVIPAGQNSIIVNVDAINDGIIEGPENVVLTLTDAASTSNAFTVDPSGGQATVNIVDANAASTTPLQVVAGTNATEGGVNGTFIIKFAGDVTTTSARPVTVGYQLGGTASAGVDYQSFGTIVIPANTHSITVNLNAIDDHIIEPTETVTFTLLSGSATDGGGNAFLFPPDPVYNDITMTITDDDALPTNQVLKVVKSADGAEGGSNGSFTVSLKDDYTADKDVTVLYTLGGTATQNTDYTVNSVTLPAYAHSVTIPVQVIDDKVIEPAETVVLTLANSTGGNGFTYTPDGSSKEATVNITDNDNTPESRVLSVSSGGDAAEPSGNSSFTISLPAGITAAEDITVNYTMSGTATNGADYNSLPGTAVIPAGQSAVTVPIHTIDDQVIEGTETIAMTLDGGSSASFGGFTPSATAGNAVMNMTDDDLGNLTVQVTNAADGAEGGVNGSVTIALPANMTCTEPVSVNYTVGGTATPGADYTALSGTAVILPGNNSVTVPVNIIDDQVIEPAETVTFTLNGGSSPSFVFANGTNSTATVNITDNDNTTANRTLIVTRSEDAAEPGTPGQFTISLPAGVTVAEPVTVYYTVTGSATPGADYETLSGTVILPAGANSVTVPVSVIDDQEIETAETIILTVNNGSTTTLGAFTASTSNGTATVNLADDDAQLTDNLVLSVVRTTDAAEPDTNGLFTISLPSGVTVNEPVTIRYTMSGTAGNGTDYTALSGSVVLPAGQNSVTVPVVVNNDRVIENTETAVLTLGNSTSASFSFTPGSAYGSATMYVYDDDNVPANTALQVTAGGNAAEPGTNSLFTIGLPAGFTAAEPITVHYSTGGTATSGTDYVALSGTATIPAGSNSITIPVTIIDDQLIENTETLVLTLNGASGTSLTGFTATASATVNISDNDSTGNNVLSVVASAANAAEPSTNGAFTISLPNGVIAAGDVVVNYTVGGTAKPGVDYVALSGTATIPAGASSVQVPVIVIDNQQVDRPRTVTLSVTGGEMARVTFTAGALSNATVTISDNDVQSFVTWKTVALSAGNNTGMVHQGEQMTYTIHVRNTGSITIPSVTITDPVPAHTSYVSGGTLNGNAVSFILGNLAAGATAEVSFVVQADSDLKTVRSITNTAQVNDGMQTLLTGSCDPAAPGCAVGSTGTVTEVATGDLIIAKQVINPATGPYRMGMDITYRITVSNKSDFSFSGVTVTDTLPAALQLPKATSTGRGQVTIDPVTRILSWTPGNISGNDQAELTMVCRILEGGELSNAAMVRAAEPEMDSTNNRAVATITVQGLNLYFPNTITPNGDGKNDRFIIGGLEKYPGSHIRIYNRWGSEVYRSASYNNDWNGGNLASGVYFYVLEVNTGDGVKPYKGWIQILR